MKYTKPTYAIEGLRFQCRNDSPNGHGRELITFLDALPDEFEIVQPGMTQVRWPEGYTRGMLEMSADQLSRSAQAAYTVAALRAIAAVAPERKKRMVEIWQRDMDGRLDAWEYPQNPKSNCYGWHKVGGPFEIEE